MCYDRDTTGIRLRARFIGSVAQYANGVTLEHQRATGSGTISGIDIGLEIDAPGAMYPVRFRSYLDNPSPPPPFSEEPSTANKWDRITISGNLATTQRESITFGALTAQGAEGRLTLKPCVKRHQSRQPHYPGFVVSTTHGREFRTVKGNIATTITIPFLAFETYPFEIIVTT